MSILKITGLIPSRRRCRSSVQWSCRWPRRRRLQGGNEREARLASCSGWSSARCTGIHLVLVCFQWVSVNWVEAFRYFIWSLEKKCSCKEKNWWLKHGSEWMKRETFVSAEATGLSKSDTACSACPFAQRASGHHSHNQHRRCHHYHHHHHHHHS